jgi:hypothetical protein
MPRVNGTHMLRFGFERATQPFKMQQRFIAI